MGGAGAFATPSVPSAGGAGISIREICAGAGSAAGAGGSAGGALPGAASAWLTLSVDGHRDRRLVALLSAGRRAARRDAAGPGAWPPGSPGESSSDASPPLDAPVSAARGGLGAASWPPPPSPGLRDSRCTPVPGSRCSFDCGTGPLPPPSTIAAPRPYSVAPRALRYSRCRSFHCSSDIRCTGANGTPMESAFF